MMNYNCDHRNRKYIVINRSEDKNYDIYECECHTTFWINKETRKIDMMERNWAKVEMDGNNRP